VFALMGKRLLIKRFEEISLAPRKLTVGRLIEQRRAKRLHLAGMIAASTPNVDAPPVRMSCHGKILGEPQGMPHGGNVEAAPDANTAPSPGPGGPPASTTLGIHS